jgi:hypothetical protein
MCRQIYLRAERVIASRHCRHGSTATTCDATTSETARKIDSQTNGLHSLGFARRDKRGRGPEKSVGSLNERPRSGLRVGVWVESRGTGSDVGRGHCPKWTRGCTAPSCIGKRVKKLSNFVIMLNNSYMFTGNNLCASHFDYVNLLHFDELTISQMESYVTHFYYKYGLKLHNFKSLNNDSKWKVIMHI